MKSLTVRMLLLAGIGTIVMTVPASASPTVSGSKDARPTQAAVQYAQDFSRGSAAVDYGYKSKKSKSSKSKTHTTGQAKSPKTDTTKTDAPK